jgi:serine/threonine-protein kinase
MSDEHRPSSIDGIKRRAKAIKSQNGISHGKALEVAAQEAGFANYTNARHRLAAREPAPSLPEVQRPPSMAASGGRDQFLENCRRSWIETFDAIDPERRDQVVWEGPSAIRSVLDGVVKRTRSHAHLPTGGGQDIGEVRRSREPGCLELQVDRGSAYIAKPARLILQRVPRSPAQSFLLLELDPLAASGAYPPDEDYDNSDPDRDWLRRREEVVELRPGEYVERSVWDQGFVEYDRQGREIPLPDEARLLVRWFDGKILFVTKGSMWNGTSGTYDGRHDKMTTDDIRAMIERSLPVEEIVG